jgi:hypothetical protein
LARQRRAPQYDGFLFSTFLFSDIAAPATNGRRAIAPRGQCDPHQPAVDQFF